MLQENVCPLDCSYTCSIITAACCRHENYLHIIALNIKISNQVVFILKKIISTSTFIMKKAPKKLGLVLKCLKVWGWYDYERNETSETSLFHLTRLHLFDKK